MDMIVTSRVCRYGHREYRRGERIPDVAPNHAVVLRTLRKAEDAPVGRDPVGLVASTAATMAMSEVAQPALKAEALAPAPVRAEDAELAGGDPKPQQQAPEEHAAPSKRRRYSRRDLRSED